MSHTTRTLRRLLAVLLFFSLLKISAQTTYFSKSTGDLNQVSTWGTNPDGTGTSPANFTLPGCIYVITNTSTATIGAGWTVSGTGSKVQTGDGVNPVEFIIPATFAFTGTVDVQPNGTLTTLRTTGPAFGILAAGSTVKYSGAGNQTIPSADFYNLTIQGGGVKTLANTNNVSITNLLTIDAGSSFRCLTLNTLTTSISGSVTGSGEFLGNANSNLLITGAGDFGSISSTVLLSLRTLEISRVSGTVTLGTNVTVSTDFIHNSGTLALNGNLLTLNGSITFPVSEINGSLRGSATSSVTIGASVLTVTNSLLMDHSVSSGGKLSRFSFNRTGQTLVLGNDLSVTDNFVHNNGLISINGTALQISGALTFPANILNGSFTGSPTSSLTIGGSGTIGGTIKIDQTSQNTRTFHSLTIDRSGGGTLILGNDIICENSFSHINGPVTVGTTVLTLNGDITFPASAANGSFTGSNTSSLVINGSGIITNALQMSQAGTAAQTFDSFLFHRPGETLTLGSGLTIRDLTHLAGTIDINGNLLTLSRAVQFPTSASNGVLRGSITSSLSIANSTASEINPLFLDQNNDLSRTLSAFTLVRLTQTLTLGNSINVTDNFVQTSGIIDLAGNALSLSGAITFPTTVANGGFIGSSTSSLSITGSGIVSNSLKMNQASVQNRTLHSLIVDRIGGTLILGDNLICESSFVHQNGAITVGATQLTLNGSITFPMAATNGSFTGSTTSSLIIGGSGTISNALFMSQASAGAQTFDRLVFSRQGEVVTLGSSATIRDLVHNAGIISLAGNLLTLSREITFPATITDGCLRGSPASSLAILTSTALVTNAIRFDQNNDQTRTLASFALARLAQTITIGNNLIIDGSFVHTSALLSFPGVALSLSGNLTFPTTTLNGVFIGSPTSTLNITGSGLVSNSLKMDQATDQNRSLHSFLIDITGGTLIIGGDLICENSFVHNNGPVTVGTSHLFLKGAVTFPLSAANGSFTGSNTSSLTITGSGSVSNRLFMSQASTAAQTFDALNFNRPGTTLTLGNSATVRDLLHDAGIIDLGGNLLTLSRTVTFPASAGNGSFRGSTTSSLSVSTSTAPVTNPITFDQQPGALSSFTLARLSQTIVLGTNLTVSDNFVHTTGVIDLTGRSLAIAGNITFPTSVANGRFIGSSTSSLSVSGGGTILNTLKLDQASDQSRTLHTMILNVTGGTLTIGDDLICENNFIHSNGPLAMGPNLLTLNGAITFPSSAASGSITGSTTSSLSIGGSGSITNPLFMSVATAAAQTFNYLAFDRPGAVVVLGNSLTVNTFSHTSGQISLNGAHLTINSAAAFPALISSGSFIGSLTSSLSIAGSGTVINTLKMDQSTTATRSLFDLYFRRPGQTLTLGTALHIRNSVTPAGGTLATGNFLTLKANSTRSGMVGVVAGVISGTITVETHAPGNLTGWTHLGPSGVNGLTVADWERQMPMTCYGCPHNQNSTGSFFVSIQGYNETGSGAAAYVPLSYTSALTRGAGYWVYLGNGSYTTSSITYSVKGTPVTGVITRPVTISANAGQNLLANPYPAPIDWDLVAADAANTTIDGSVSFYNPDIGQYVTYAGGVSTPAGYITNGVVPMGQGFYVQAVSAGNVTFRESHKSNENTASNPLLRSGETNERTGDVLRLTLFAPYDQHDETVIRLHRDATTGFDRILDAKKIYGLPGGTPSDVHRNTTISTVIGHDHYAINSVPDAGSIHGLPVLVNVRKAGTFTLSATGVENIGECLLIEDRLAKVSHDLRTGPYVFSLQDTATAERFVLKPCSADAEKSLPGENGVTIGKDGQTLVIRTKFDRDIVSHVRVCNMLGQDLMPATFAGPRQTLRLDLGHAEGQVIIVSISNEAGMTTKKVILD